MNFSLFCRFLNNLYLFLVLNFICVLCQSLDTNSWTGVKHQNNDSLKNSNISQVYEQSDRKYETILSNPSTENILSIEEVMSESTTKSSDPSDESITEVNDIFKTTAEPIIFTDLTTLITIDYLKDSNQRNATQLNNQQITSPNITKQILNNSHINEEIEISKNAKDFEISDSTLFDISLDNYNSKDISEMTSTSTQLSTADESLENDYNKTETEIMEKQITSINQYNDSVINDSNNNKRDQFINIENHTKSTETVGESTTEYNFETISTTELKNNAINETDLEFNAQISLENSKNAYSEDNVTQMTQVTNNGSQIDQGSLTDHYTEQNDEMDVSQTTTTTPSNIIKTTDVYNEELIQTSNSSENYFTIITQINEILGNIQINNNTEGNQTFDNNSNDSLNDSSTQTSHFEVNSNFTSNNTNATNIYDLNPNKTLEDMTKTNSFKTMCTFGGWSAYRQGLGRFEVNDLKKVDFVLSRCTHLIYSFVALNSDTSVVSLDPKRELIPETGTFALLKDLKNQNKHLKIMLAVGGWDTPADIWTYLLSSSARRHKTVINIIEFVRKYSFDGLVISWFYPGAKWRGGHDSDKQHLITFLQDLNSKIVWPDFELAIMAPAIKEDIDIGFDIPIISDLVDHLLLMTYDYFGSWDSTVNHLAPLYSNSNKSDNLNVNFTLHYWLNNGADPKKVVLGLATYGRSFTLENPKNNKENSLSIGPGIAGPYTNRPGIMGFNEICETFLSTSGVQLEEDRHKVTPFIHLKDQWIGFEDELSVFVKTTYALDNQLEGIFFWTLDLDDFHNKCEWGHFPLLRAALQAIYQTKNV